MLGKIAFVDFLLHAGAGAASITTLIAAMRSQRILEQLHCPKLIIWLLSAPIGIGVLGCQISILAFIAATKSQRTEQWVLSGYFAGLVVVGVISAVFYYASRVEDGKSGI